MDTEHTKLGKLRAKCQRQGIKKPSLVIVKPAWSEGKIRGQDGEWAETSACVNLRQTMNKGTNKYLHLLIIKAMHSNPHE